MTISDYSNTANLLKTILDKSLRAKTLIARRFYGKPVISKEEAASVYSALRTLEDLGLVESVWVAFTEGKAQWCFGITEAGKTLLEEARR